MTSFYELAKYSLKDELITIYSLLIIFYFFQQVLYIIIKYIDIIIENKIN